MQIRLLLTTARLWITHELHRLRNHWGIYVRASPKLARWNMLLLRANFHFKQTFGTNSLQTVKCVNSASLLDL